MSWQWVVLVTGVVAELVFLLGYVSWANMKMKMFEVAVSGTIPDQAQPTNEDTIIEPADADTIIKLPEWPEKDK